MRTLALFLACFAGIPAIAQDPTLVESNMQFTKKIIAQYHYVAWVAIELKPDQYTRYQYDHYPDSGTNKGVERIKADEGIFARPKNGDWLKSDDWGETGKPVDEALAQELDMYVSIVNVQLAAPSNSDPTQGQNVWKFIEQTNDKTFTYYTYERTREHPHPDGIYPRFTFMKAEYDTDGQLFLSKSTGQLRSGDTRIPFTIQTTYLVPVPADAKIEVFDQVTGKKKYQSTADKNSGWEITTQQSAPPAN